MDNRVIFLLYAEAIFAFLILYRSKLLTSKWHIIGAAAVIFVAIMARRPVFYIESADYADCLSVWVEFY